MYGLGPGRWGSSARPRSHGPSSCGRWSSGRPRRSGRVGQAVEDLDDAALLGDEDAAVRREADRGRVGQAAELGRLGESARTAAEGVASPGTAGLAGNSAPTRANAAMTRTANDDGRPPRDSPPLAATQSLPSTARSDDLATRRKIVSSGRRNPVSQLRSPESNGIGKIFPVLGSCGPPVVLRSTIIRCPRAPSESTF